MVVSTHRPAAENGQSADMSAAIASIPAAARTRQEHDSVRVLDHLEQALAGLRPAEAEMARTRCIAPRIVLGTGTWQPPDDAEACRDWIGLLVLDGLLTRTVSVEGLRAQELLGPGDVLRPWDDDSTSRSVAISTSWKVLERASVALLDGRFAATSARWPSVASSLVGAAVRRSQNRAILLAIARARSAETRLLLLFWHLADRWGRVGPDGIHIPVQLTHARVSELVCLRRPTVSASLARLRADGRLQRTEEGAWVLGPDALPGGPENEEAKA